MPLYKFDKGLGVGSDSTLFLPWYTSNFNLCILYFFVGNRAVRVNFTIRRSSNFSRNRLRVRYIENRDRSAANGKTFA